MIDPIRRIGSDPYIPPELPVQQVQKKIDDSRYKDTIDTSRAWIAAMIDQIELSGSSSKLRSEEVSRIAKSNQTNRKASNKLMDENADLSGVAKGLGIVQTVANVALTMSALLTLGFMLFSGAGSLPALLVIATGASGILKGFTMGAKGYVDYRVNATKADLLPLTQQAKKNSEKTHDIIMDWGKENKERNDHFSLLAKDEEKENQAKKMWS